MLAGQRMEVIYLFIYGFIIYILLVNTYIAISDCCLNPKMTKTRRADCDKLCGFSHDTRRAIIYPDLSIPFISKREGNGTGSYVFPLATLGQDYIPRNILVSECGDASCF